MMGMSGAAAAAISLVITAIMGVWLIPFLRKLKFGQTIIDIGPTWHQSKQGTPTMGGIMFIIGITAGIIAGIALFGQQTNSPLTPMIFRRVVSGFVMALAYGFIGFVDDYIKVVKKRNLGLTAKQKIVMQVLIAGCYLFSLYLLGDTSTSIIIPFLGQMNLGVFYYPFMMIFIVGFVNAVNLTDGIDGLSGSVTFTAALGFIVVSGIFGMWHNALVSAALAGGMIGYLIFNFYPAKVFMGDTGSMFLGGLVVALAFGTGMPLVLFLTGIIYFVEAMSVVLQVASFKLTGKRIFKMSPIHHHFEMSGFKETKIVMLFSFVTLIGCILAVIAAASI